MKSSSSYLRVFNKLEKANEVPENEIAYKFPYELDNFQKQGIYGIHNNENVLITAHTGSGKTVLAIYAIAHALKHNKKVIYTSPTKSLSNQKFSEFKEKFESVGILTGDIKMNPDAQCIIMTTEILRNMLYKENNTENASSSYSLNMDINEIGAVIFDEVHYINDPDRGKVWEEVIVLLPPQIILVMLSATIDKPDEFASWIGDIKQKPIHLIPTSHRVVPLKHYYWKGTQFINNNGKDEISWTMIEMLSASGEFKNYDIMRNKFKVYDVNKLMDKLVDYLVDENYIPALFFKFSRKKCEELCRMVRKNLLTHEEMSSVEKIFNFQMRNYKKIYEKLPQYQSVYDQLLKGVVYHHSGLIPILKEIIEILYSKGLIKILFATETFSIGVNMPTKTVLFTDLDKYDNMGASSMLKIDFSSRNKDDPDYNRENPQKEIIVNGIRLDTFINENNINNIDLLCMDLQGYELNALKSLGNHLYNIKYIITECSIKSTYINGVSFKELEEYLKNYNFIYVLSNKFGELYPNLSITGFSEFDSLFINKNYLI